jgi:membrane protein YdbS with pleckstrin-like domain
VRAVKAAVLRWLKVPPAPHVPPGEESSCHVFRAGKGYYDYIRLGWGFGQAGALIGLAFGVAFLHFVPEFGLQFRFGRWQIPVSTAVFSFLEALAIVGFVFQLPLTYWALTWDYECRFYLLSDRSLRIQEGIWSFREQTFTLANIQQIDVRQGPVQKLFGISDVVVSTAGGGGGSAGQDAKHQHESMHEGCLRGVTGAAAIRDRLLTQMKRYRDSGLGEGPIVKHGTRSGDTVDSLVGLRSAVSETVSEIRALRQALETAR